MKALAVLREAVAAAWGAKVASIATIVIVAGMVLAVLLTSGRTVGAQQAVVNTLDDAGTRAVVVHAQEGSGLDSSTLARLRGISSIAWMGGFGLARDATNSAVADSRKVPIRLGYGINLASLGVDQPSIAGAAYASATALEQLGMQGVGGSVTTVDGIDYSIAGVLDVPDYLEFLEPLIVVPVHAQLQPSLSVSTTDHQVRRGEPLSILVAIAADASQVAPVQTTVM